MALLRTFAILSLVLGIVASSSAEVLSLHGRPSLVLEGTTARIAIDLGGGSISEFRLQNSPLNPLKWGNQGPTNQARPLGHFLCLDRWGQPSPGEARHGMPFHGEAANVHWKILEKPAISNGAVRAALSAELPLAGLAVRRKVFLSTTNAWCVVEEEVENLRKLGRVFNMVQHPTIGPPFLDESTIVDCNATKGFMQSSPLPNPEEPQITWPFAPRTGTTVDLRFLRDNHDPSVTSFILASEYGWVTAANPEKRLLIGYIWKRADYPWFNAWRFSAEGRPVARGLEFGTTGLHQPYPVLVRKARIFETPLFEYIDAGEKIKKSYAFFLLAIPPDYKGVEKLELKNQRLVLQERDSKRELTIDGPAL